MARIGRKLKVTIRDVPAQRLPGVIADKPKRRSGGGGGSSGGSSFDSSNLTSIEEDQSEPTPAEVQAQQSLVPSKRFEPPQTQQSFQSFREPSRGFLTPSSRTLGEFGQNLARQDLQNAFQSESERRQQSLDPNQFVKSPEGQRALSRTQGNFGLNLRNTPEFQSLTTRQRTSLVANEFFEFSNPRSALLESLGAIGEPRTETNFGLQIQQAKDRPRTFVGIAGGFIGESALFTSFPKAPKFEDVVSSSLEKAPTKNILVKNQLGEIDFVSVKGFRNPANFDEILGSQVSRGKIKPVEGEPFLKFSDIKVTTKITRSGGKQTFGQVDLIPSGVLRGKNIESGGIISDIFPSVKARKDFPSDFKLSESNTRLVRGKEIFESNDFLVSKTKGAFTRFNSVEPTKLVKTGELLDIPRTGKLKRTDLFGKVRGRFSGDEGLLIDLTKLPNFPRRTTKSSRVGNIPSVSDVLGGNGQSSKVLSQLDFQIGSVSKSSFKSVQLPKQSSSNILTTSSSGAFTGTGLYERTDFVGGLEAPRFRGGFGGNIFNPQTLREDFKTPKNIGGFSELGISQVSKSKSSLSPILRGSSNVLQIPAQRQFRNPLLDQPQLTKQGQDLFQAPRQTLQDDFLRPPRGLRGGFEFDSFRGFNFPLGFPGGDLLNTNPPRRIGKRKFRRTPSLIAVELGIFSKKAVRGESTGLIVRPQLFSKGKKKKFLDFSGIL